MTKADHLLRIRRRELIRRIGPRVPSMTMAVFRHRSLASLSPSCLHGHDECRGDHLTVALHLHPHLVQAGAREHGVRRDARRTRRGVLRVHVDEIAAVRAQYGEMGHRSERYGSRSSTGIAVATSVASK